MYTQLLFCHLQDIRLPCVTGILVPEGMNWKDVANYAMKTYVSKEVIHEGCSESLWKIVAISTSFDQ